MKKQFTKEQLASFWGSEKTINFAGRKYRVGRMSYGDYFFEPISWKGGETKGHSPNTIWAEPVKVKNQYGYEQTLYEIKKRKLRSIA